MGSAGPSSFDIIAANILLLLVIFVTLFSRHCLPHINYGNVNTNSAVFDRIASVCGGESICRNLAEALCWLAGNHFQHDELDSDGQGGTKFSVYRSVFIKLSLFIDGSHEKQYESSL